MERALVVLPEAAGDRLEGLLLGVRERSFFVAMWDRPTSTKRASRGMARLPQGNRRARTFVAPREGAPAPLASSPRGESDTFEQSRLAAAFLPLRVAARWTRWSTADRAIASCVAACRKVKSLDRLPARGVFVWGPSRNRDFGDVSSPVVTSARRRHRVAHTVHCRTIMKRLVLTSASLLLPAIVATASPALAQDRDGDGVPDRERAPAIPQVDPNSPSGIFGGRGQIAISSDAGLFISHRSPAEGEGTTQLQLRPAVDYFVADNLSVGGFLGLDYGKTGGSSSTAISIGPRVGYNIPLSEMFSVWPKVGFSFSSTSSKYPAPEPDRSNTAFQLNLFAPFLLHPAQHFFIGFGPALDVDLSGDNKATTIAGRLTLGGWI